MSDSATPWTVACQTPLSMGFSRQVYWSGLAFPSPGDLPNLRDWTQVFRIAGRFCLSNQGSPSSISRVQTQVPYTGRWILYLWPTREAPKRTFLCMCTSTRTESVCYSNLIIQISLCYKCSHLQIRKQMWRGWVDHPRPQSSSMVGRGWESRPASSRSSTFEKAECTLMLFPNLLKHRHWCFTSVC